jgi:hypothetical protein
MPIQPARATLSVIEDSRKQKPTASLFTLVLPLLLASVRGCPIEISDLLINNPNSCGQGIDKNNILAEWTPIALKFFSNARA